MARRPRFPVLWIISAGRPERVLQEYAFSGMTGWPPGFWMRQPADGLRLVVVSELPRERDTLLLRLMGSGRVQEDALAELEGLPEDAWEHEVASENVVAFRARLPKNGTDEERRFMLNTNGIYEKWVKKHRAEGRKKGVKKGRAQLAEELLHDQLVRDLRRDLTAAERKLLTARARALSAGELRELLADTAPDALRLRLLGPDGA